MLMDLNRFPVFLGFSGELISQNFHHTWSLSSCCSRDCQSLGSRHVLTLGEILLVCRPGSPLISSLSRNNLRGDRRKMARGKTKMEKIDKLTVRQVTFSSFFKIFIIRKIDGAFLL